MGSVLTVNLLGMLLCWATLFPKTVVAEIRSIDHDKSLHFVSGTHAEYLEDPIFYDSYLPLVFQFQVPKHMENAMKVMWSHATVCNASDSRYDGKLCPVVHHLHKIVANLSSDMGFWKDFLPENLQDNLDQEKHEKDRVTPVSRSSKKPKTPHSTPVTPDCLEISPHFKHPYIPKDQLDQYLKSLENCPLGQATEPIIKLPHNWIIDKQIYYTMVDRFYSEFYRALPGTGNIDWVVTLNSYVNIQSLLLSNNYMESNRVHNAFLQCSQKLIPQSFIPTKMLKTALASHKAKVYSSHFKYLWDLEDSESNDDDGDGVQHYYKLPIADCTFTDDYQLIVRLLIPVKIPDVDTRLLQVRTLPFIQKVKGDRGPLHLKNKNSKAPLVEPMLKLCKLQAPGSIRIIESNSGLLFENGGACEPHQLCQRSDLNSFLPLDSCVSAILSNNESHVRSQCKLACFPIDQTSLPIFKRQSSDSFLAVGSEYDKIFIQCNGGQPLEKLVLANVGAMEIRLSCGCQISYRNMVLQPTYPCSEDQVPRVRHVLPLHWQSFLNASNNNTLDGLKLDGDEDENLILDALERQEMEKYYGYDVDNDVPDNKKEQVNGKNSDKAGASRQISIEPHTECEDGSIGRVVGLSILWLFVLALLTSNAFLLYNVYHLNKWKKLQVYKDTRIVYSVPPSPQFPNKF